MSWLKNRRERRAERAAHNDRDYACKHWWGDRSGSAVGVARERCKICNPAPAPEVEETGDYWSDLGGPWTTRGDYY